MTRTHADTFLASLQSLSPEAAERLWISEPAYRPFLKLAGFKMPAADDEPVTQPDEPT